MHMKILAIFIGLALLALTASAQFDRFDQFDEGPRPPSRRFGHRFGGIDNACECSGRFRRTRICCDENGGFLRGDRCVGGGSGRFLRCCEFEGGRGACFS